MQNGRAELMIDGAIVPAMAYITYFGERRCITDFAKAGYRVFSLCAYTTALPCNPRTLFSPSCGKGIFDVKGEADYRDFDENVRAIIRDCPDALIFPRVFLSMPQWWVDENPNEVCTTALGHKREALFSRKFRQDGAAMLRELIAHIHASDYAEHIIGYQISGGSTQEWFHYDGNGSLSPCSKACFNEYLGNPNPPVEVPDHNLARVSGLIEDPLMQKYLEFISFEIGNSIAYFAKAVKECVDRKQIVGTFYGYSQSMFDMFEGNIGASVLLDCEDIDFFSAPVSYVKQRAMGIDWGDLCAGESIRQHKKLYFVENDIRTCLSDFPSNCRPGFDPEKKYTSAVWLGPPTVAGSVAAIRKAFSRQYTHGNSMWWFDMWGKWYENEVLMTELAQCHRIFEDFTKSEKQATRSQVVVLCDEKLPFRLGSQDPCVAIQETVRDQMGATGIPSDALIMEDYKACAHYDYVLIPFPESFDTEEVRKAKAFLMEKGIPFTQLTQGDFAIDARQLRERLAALGAHCYCDTGDVIYCGNGLLAIHAATEGEKTIRLPKAFACKDLDTGAEETTDTLKMYCQQYETKWYWLQ